MIRTLGNGRNERRGRGDEWTECQPNFRSNKDLICESRPPVTPDNSLYLYHSQRLDSESTRVYSGVGIPLRTEMISIKKSAVYHNPKCFSTLLAFWVIWCIKQNLPARDHRSQQHSESLSMSGTHVRLGLSVMLVLIEQKAWVWWNLGIFF